MIYYNIIYDTFIKLIIVFKLIYEINKFFNSLRDKFLGHVIIIDPSSSVYGYQARKHFIYLKSFVIMVASSPNSTSMESKTTWLNL